MTTQEFVTYALQGFGLGFGLGFLLWATCYAFKIFRRSFFAALRIVE